MPKLYISLSGQDDNIGDSLLRRAYCDYIRSLGEIHILCSQDDDYLSGLGLKSGDKVYRDRSAWFNAFKRDVRSNEKVFWFHNAGELCLSKKSALKDLVLEWPWIVLNRIRGGRNIGLGVGLRNTDWWIPAFYRLRLLPYHFWCWRDAQSAGWVGRGSIGPDWAILTGLPNDVLAAQDSVPRNYLAISMRYDRPLPSSSWIDSVKGLAGKLNLKLMVVVQVKRDQERANEIAKLLESEISSWDSDSHAIAEERVRSIYHKSAIVISDRLHALLVGLSEGATPICYATKTAEKSRRTLAAIGIEGVDLLDEPNSIKTVELEVIHSKNPLFRDALLSARDKLRSSSTLKSITG